MRETAISTEPVVITEEQVTKYLPPSRLIPALEQAFRREFQYQVIAPPRTRLDLSAGQVFLAMPCYEASRGTFGIKLVTVGNGADRVRADYVLYDAGSRKRLAIIAANYLTDIRTACISAIASKLLAREESRTLGIFGTGRQGWAHVLALAAVLPFRTIACCGSQPEKSKQFADRVNATLGIDAYPSTAEECVSCSDVICCCTTSVTPLFDGSLLRPGTHLNLVGTFEKGSREVDVETVNRSRIFLETYEGPLTEGGDIATALAEGTISQHSILADLHELLSGKKPGRRQSGDITLFKSVGHAYEDLIAATLVYETMVEESLERRET
jgi:ornithine cyclodeaminase/alanine dehydrogenase-like protein (mu-crystallin family)